MDEVLRLRYLIKKERSKEIICVTLSPFDNLSITIFCDDCAKKFYIYHVKSVKKSLRNIKISLAFQSEQ